MAECFKCEFLKARWPAIYLSLESPPHILRSRLVALTGYTDPVVLALSLSLVSSSRPQAFADIVSLYGNIFLCKNCSIKSKQLFEDEERKEGHDESRSSDEFEIISEDEAEEKV